MPPVQKFLIPSVACQTTFNYISYIRQGLIPFENIKIIKSEFPELEAIPCSADSELALREAGKAGMIEYLPGDKEFKIIKVNKKQEEANKWRFSGDANFVARPQTSSSRGDYDVNSGMFRPDQYVPVQFRGNNMGNIGSPYYTAQYGGQPNEDQEVYMSDEEIQQYLAAGGQLEFLD
jgi:hypothetical protein